MKRSVTDSALAASALVLGVWTPVLASAQPDTGQLAGSSWTLVSTSVDQGGKILHPYGERPTGIFMFDTNRHFSQIIIRSDLASIRSNNRENGTPEENKSVVQGSIAYFGTYAVEGNVVTLRIENSTFPNFKGTDQKRSFTITGDQLKWTNAVPSVGAGSATLVWKRAE